MSDTTTSIDMASGGTSAPSGSKGGRAHWAGNVFGGIGAAAAALVLLAGCGPAVYSATVDEQIASPNVAVTANLNQIGNGFEGGNVSTVGVSIDAVTSNGGTETVTPIPPSAIEAGPGDKCTPTTSDPTSLTCRPSVNGGGDAVLNFFFRTTPGANASTRYVVHLSTPHASLNSTTTHYTDGAGRALK